ncbi:MAG TPA: hypothetical protein VIE91_03005 [Methylophilaceae bacterium]
MFSLEPSNPPQVIIYKDDEVPKKLWQLHPSLEEDVFYQAAGAGYAARLEVTPAHAPTAAGSFHWFYTVATIRTELKTRRWNYNDNNNCPLIVSNDKQVMIAVMTGDKDTGRPGGFPTNQGIKGVVLDKAVKKNLELFAGQNGTASDGTQLWVFLYHVELNGAIHMELSLPDSFVRGKIKNWKERIIFTPLDLRPEPKVLPTLPNDDIDFDVIRKQI